MRQLEHERGGIDRLRLQPRALPTGAARAPTRPIRSCARRSPRSRPATASAGSSCSARCCGQAPAGFSAATKCFCTEHESRVADFVARVLGAEATLWDRRRRRASCYAPGYTIMGGTSNVMRNILGERVLGLPRS